VAAVGATDQHSQLQLYMEGPQDKLILFATIDDMGSDIAIPELFQDIDSISYLGGASMGALIKSEAKATQAALAQQKRPSLNLRLPRLDAHCLGQVLFLLEAATLMAGRLLNINPLDQPGVELGKVLTYGLMGRKGFENEAKKMAEIDFGYKRLV
jgi:glucose-6-phosphate isomerase